jgi:hypothetical protein
VSHYTVEELIARWKREDLSVEQMIGQMLQVLLVQQQRLRELERRGGSSDANGLAVSDPRSGRK